MTPKNVKIKLTPEQFAQFKEMLEYTWQQCQEGRRGIIYGQLDPKASPEDETAVIVFGFADHEIAKGIVYSVSPEQYEYCIDMGFIKGDGSQ